MPHLVILYTGNLESRTDVSALCRGLVDVMLQRRGDAVHRDVGEALNALVRKHFAPLQDREHMGIPADIDLGPRSTTPT
jgi:5-carboxymethyl-2-hydroxymuconate isomerase